MNRTPPKIVQLVGEQLPPNAECYDLKESLRYLHQYLVRTVNEEERADTKESDWLNILLYFINYGYCQAFILKKLTLDGIPNQAGRVFTQCIEITSNPNRMAQLESGDCNLEAGMVRYYAASEDEWLCSLQEGSNLILRLYEGKLLMPVKGLELAKNVYIQEIKGEEWDDNRPFPKTGRDTPENRHAMIQEMLEEVEARSSAKGMPFERTSVPGKKEDFIELMRYFFGSQPLVNKGIYTYDKDFTELGIKFKRGRSPGNQPSYWKAIFPEIYPE